MSTYLSMPDTISLSRRRAAVPHLPERAQEEAEGGARRRHGVGVPPLGDRPQSRLQLPQPGDAADAKHVQGGPTGCHTSLNANDYAFSGVSQARSKQ